MRSSIRSSRRRVLPLLALFLILAMVAAACGGGSDNKSGSGTSGDEGKPQYGGKIVYGIEAKTTNFCLPRAQLAIAGIMVTEAVYDTLTRPTDDPQVYAPYLAKSVDHNADYTEWTIVVRDGVKFHDGTPLTGDAVKQNIDAWRKGLLLSFVFTNIADTQVTAPDTVVVKMKVPWIAFPAYLWATGRVGIAAPAQLNNDATCDRNMIGTGPFQVMNGGSFNPATGDVKVVKNPNYWRKGYPYLNEIDFKPQEESSQRVNGLQGGQFTLIHGSGGVDLSDAQALPGVNVTLEPQGRQEIGHTLLNVTRPPLDDLNARKAIAEALDRDALNQIANKGTFRLAYQVFDKDVMGYVKDPGFPKRNVDDAKKLVSAYKAAHGGKFEFSLQSTFDQTTQQLAAEVKRELAAVGITVNLPPPVDQATIISQAIGSAVDAFLWRNYPGADPDTMYVWFHSGSTVNFNHVSDPVMDEALDKGRSEPDPDKRREYYEAFNRRMSQQVYNLWSWYTQWFVAAKNNVHGLTGPNLPDASGNVGKTKPVPMLAGYHQLLGIWVSK